MAAYPPQHQYPSRGEHEAAHFNGHTMPYQGPGASQLPQCAFSDYKAHPDIHQHAAPHGQPPLSSTQPSTKPTMSERLAAGWWLEVLGLIISAASLAGLAYILFRFNGKALSEADFGPLGINTIVSILAVVSKMGAVRLSLQS